MKRWERLQFVIDSWRGTRYANGQGLRGVSSDCIGFVGGVLDELHNYNVAAMPPIPRHAPDLAWHDPKEAARITLEISQRWPHEVIKPKEWTPEPGDILLKAVTARGTGGHVLLTGANPVQVWHCDQGTGVCYTGLGVVLGELIRIWRPLDKSTW